MKSKYIIPALVLTVLLAGCGKAANQQASNGSQNGMAGFDTTIDDVGTNKVGRTQGSTSGNTDSGSGSTLASGQASGDEGLREGVPVQFGMKVEQQNLRVGDKTGLKLLISSKDPITFLSSSIHTSPNIHIKSIDYEKQNFPDDSSTKVGDDGVSASGALGNKQGIQGMNFTVAKIEIEAVDPGDATVSLGQDTKVIGQDGTDITPKESPTVQLKVE